MNKVIQINEKNIAINHSIDQALQDCASDKEEIENVLIIEVLKNGSYRYIQGGQDSETMSFAQMYWHLEQMQCALLEDRIDHNS